MAAAAAITGPICPALSSCCRASVDSPCLQQRDAEVVRGESGQVLRALQSLQDIGRVGRPTNRQVDVGAKELDVVLDVLGHLAMDSLQRVQSVLRLVFLEVDAREAKRRFVAHLSSTSASRTALIARPARWCMR